MAPALADRRFTISASHNTQLPRYFAKEKYQFQQDRTRANNPPPFQKYPSSPPLIQKSHYNFKVTHCTVTLPHYTSAVLISLEINFHSLKEGPTQRKGLQLKKVFACGNEKQTESSIT